MAGKDPVPMKTNGRNSPSRRLTSLKQDLCYIQEERHRVVADHSLDTERRALEITCYDPILRYLLERIERLEAALRCAAGSA